MKNLKYLLVAAPLLGGCTNFDEKSTDSVTISIAVDSTDSLLVYPDKHLVLETFDFKRYVNKAATFRFRAITDQVLNPIFETHIDDNTTTERDNFMDYVYYREELVKQFCTDVSKCLTSQGTPKDTFHELQYSEIFAAISDELWILNSSKTRTKLFFVYSNLKENATFNAYKERSENLLSNEPDSVFGILNKEHPLPPNLKGVTVVFVYLPKNRIDEHRFLLLFRNIYKKQLEKRHAVVILQSTNKFTAP